jgi:hypothetical protein
MWHMVPRTSASPLAMWHMVPRPVPFTWQCVIRYHDQGLSPGIMSCGTTTSVFHMAMCHMGKRPVQPSNMLYGTTPSVFHLAMCYAVPRPMPFTWQCVMRYHDQCNLAMCHAVPQTVYFTWQCAIRYHDQSLSPGHMLCVTTNEEIITNFMTTLSMKMNL